MCAKYYLVILQLLWEWEVGLLGERSLLYFVLVHVEGVVEYLVKVFLVEVVFAISLEDSPSVVRG